MSSATTMIGTFSKTRLKNNDMPNFEFLFNDQEFQNCYCSQSVMDRKGTIILWGRAKTAFDQGKLNQYLNSVHFKRLKTALGSLFTWTCTGRRGRFQIPQNSLESNLFFDQEFWDGLTRKDLKPFWFRIQQQLFRHRTKSWQCFRFQLKPSLETNPSFWLRPEQVPEEYFSAEYKSHDDVTLAWNAAAAAAAKASSVQIVILD